MAWESAGVGSCRYGANALWVLRDELCGSRGRRFAEHVDLFFRGGERSLLLDLREAGPVDSAGAAALEKCRARHRGFRPVGLPRCWVDLPAPVRRALRRLEPLPSLESALAAQAAPADAAERRLHPRILVQIPVELLTPGGTTTVSLQDISRGGVRLSMVPEGWFPAEAAGRPFGILGLETDPLGREICTGRARGPIPAVAVGVPAGGRLGARFADSPPPV